MFMHIKITHHSKGWLLASQENPRVNKSHTASRAPVIINIIGQERAIRRRRPQNIGFTYESDTDLFWHSIRRCRHNIRLSVGLELH